MTGLSQADAESRARRRGFDADRAHAPDRPARRGRDRALAVAGGGAKRSEGVDRDDHRRAARRHAPTPGPATP